MNQFHTGLLTAGFIGLCLLQCSALLASEQAAPQEWRFRVSVDDKEVGIHEFQVHQQGNQQVLSTMADFEYKLLFVTLFSYQHQDVEIWADGCLARIESSTDANGKDYAVLGEQREEGFVVEGSKGLQVLPACVMSFAYWNPAFLKADKLLNSQNGDYMDVTVSEPVNDELMVLGQSVTAKKYSLKADKLQLQLWYSATGEWLGLESVQESGRILRYELLPDSGDTTASNGVAVL